jgi:PAS domain S-box-containing protein
MATILLVDDREENRYLLRMMLSTEPHRLLEAANGVEALDLARSAPPDLVIADILMPVMDGYTLCRSWRLDPQLAEIPFAFFTATYTAPQDEAFALRLGATRFITKPIEVTDFVATVNEILAQRGAGMRPTPAPALEEETTYYRLYNEVLIDKLETKLAELEATNQALRASEERFRHISSATTDIAYSCSSSDGAAYVIDWMSGAVEAITGYTAAEIQTQGGWASLIAAEDLPRFEEHIVGLAPNATDASELRLRRKDGELVWVIFSAKCVPDDQDAGRLRLFGSLVDITQRKATEEALRASEAALRRSQEIAKVGHWVWDTRANRVSWSDEMFRIFGVDQATFDGDLDQVIAQAIHPDDVERVFAANANVVEHAAPAATEYRVVWPNGVVRHVWAVPSDTLLDEHGQILQLSGIVQDITERKRAEEQQHLQAVALEAAANGIVITDIDGKIEWVNPAFSALTGFSLDEAIRHNPRELVRSGQHDTDYYRTMWETILAGQVWRGELVNRRKDGTLYTEEQTITPVRDEQGVIRHLIGIKQDITARKQAEAEQARLLAQVQAQAEQMAQIMETVPEGVILLDADNGILMANPHATAQLQFLAGVSRGDTLTQLAGKPLADFQTSPPAGQWHILEAGASTFEVIARAVEAGAEPGGWVLVIRDITRLRAVEQQMQRQERMAAIGQLAAGIAHDFNNLMSVITLYTQMLAKSAGLDERSLARLATIERQALRATEMIRQILDFSRRAVMERHTLDLVALLRQQVELLNRTLPEHVEIDLAVGPGDYFVKGDPTRLQQALMNLAFNARDAMPEGGRLTISVAHLAVQAPQDAPLPGMAAGEWIQLTVSDTGVGMPAEVMRHVFEPFFTTKEPGLGTGLGLAQVYGIVGQHDGHITVTSSPGGGAVFTIYMPAQPAAEAAPKAVVPPALLPSGDGKTILVVEDDVQLRATLVELLESWRYRVEQATNGMEALALLEAANAPIDLVLSDVVMPRLGGIAMFKALRQRGLQQPVILLSGHPLTRDIDELQGLGMTTWLTKPPDTEELAQAIFAALQVG